MNLFFETTGADLFIALYDHNYQIVAFTHQKKLLQKVEKIPQSLITLLKKANKEIIDIKNIYLNLGPGTFTGSRIALVFVKTLCQILDIKLWTTNTFLLIADNTQKKQLINVDARGNKMFQAQIQNGQLQNQVKILEKTIVQEIDYQKLQNQFQKFLKVFELQTDLLSITPFYGKEPQIGGL